MSALSHLLDSLIDIQSRALISYNGVIPNAKPGIFMLLTQNSP